MNTVRRWVNWQLEKVLPDPGQSFQRIEPDRVLFEEIDWSQSERVLDVGCYRGHYAHAIARRVRSVVGLDLDRMALSDFSDKSIPLLCADGQAIPLVEGSFDTILCHMTANLFPNPDRAASEFVRCCKPDGRIILSVCNLRTPFQRVNGALERRWPDCTWATVRTSRNRWSAQAWINCLRLLGATLERTYSCNLCWPLIPRIRGRWVIPNRVMHSWNRTVRQVSRLPLQTGTSHFAAHDYVFVFRMRSSVEGAAR